MISLGNEQGRRTARPRASHPSICFTISACSASFSTCRCSSSPATTFTHCPLTFSSYRKSFLERSCRHNQS